MIRSDRVSVIIPTYNSAKTIETCLRSVFEQCYKDIEIVLVDNNSADNCISIAVALLKEWNRSYQILFEKKQGVSFARNQGICNATGRFICFLDSDDRLTSDSISIRVEALVNLNCGVVYGPYWAFRSSSIDRLKLVDVPKSIDLNKMRKKNYIGNLTGMYDREVVSDVLQLDIGHEDYLMWYRLIQQVEKAYCAGQKPLGYYQADGGISSNKVIAAIWHWQILHKHLNLSIMHSLGCFSQYAIESILRRLL